MVEDCVIWQGAKDAAGYGVTWHNNKWCRAHRAVMNAKPGEIVRHLCDNPSCVNPNHLRLGTSKENSEDMVSKGRQARGELAGNSKFSVADVRLVRSYKGQLSSRQVASLMKMSKTNVLDIWNNKIWSHV